MRSDPVFILILQGITGEVSIDKNGDRMVSLQLRNLHDGRLRRVANYFGITQTLEFLNVTLIWPGGATTPPLGRPECGFDNEFCVRTGSYVSWVLNFRNSLSYQVQRM